MRCSEEILQIIPFWVNVIHRIARKIEYWPVVIITDNWAGDDLGCVSDLGS